jgi:hypothetical protein
MRSFLPRETWHTFPFLCPLLQAVTSALCTIFLCDHLPSESKDITYFQAWTVEVLYTAVVGKRVLSCFQQNLHLISMGTVRNKLSLFLLGVGVPGSLKVTEHELQTMTWPMLVDKIVQLQRHRRFCIVRQLSAHDIVSRIMRKENYMIGLLNKGVLALTLPQWVPGVGPVVGQDEHGAKKRVILTKTLEWSLNWCILQSMFDRHCSPSCPYIHAHSRAFLCNTCS